MLFWYFQGVKEGKIDLIMFSRGTEMEHWPETGFDLWTKFGRWCSVYCYLLNFPLSIYLLAVLDEVWFKFNVRLSFFTAGGVWEKFYIVHGMLTF